MPGWIIALKLTGLGWYVALCVVAGVLLGIWFDQVLGITPIATIVGTILGSVVAFWGLYRMIVPMLYGSGK